MSHPVLERLRSPDPAQRCSACADAAADPSALLLLPGLCEALGDPERRVARAASNALAELAKTLPEVEPALREALHGDLSRRRWGAAFTRARLAPPEPRLVPALVEAMSAPDGDVRWAAARILVDIARLHPEILAVVSGLLRSDEHLQVRRMAAFCLRELAPDDPAAAAALLEASQATDPALRRATFTALAALECPPPSVRSRLLEALDTDADPACRCIAATVLAQLADSPQEAGADSIAQHLRRTRDATSDPLLRRAADQALEQIGAASH